MGRYATESGGGGSFEDPPTGNHVGRCYRIIDLGTTHEENQQGEMKARNQVQISFELADKMSDGRPFSVAAWWTNSLHEKATLRTVLQTWRNKLFTKEELLRFDLDAILGVPGIVTVGLSNTGKVKVMGVGPLMKGMAVPPQVNPSFSLWLTPPELFDQAKFDTLSDKMRQRIMGSDEYKAMFKRSVAPIDNGFSAQGIDKDDIPWSDDSKSRQPGEDDEPIF